MTRLLVLRPEPGASATVERARQRGLDAVALPLFAIETVPWSAPEASAFDGVLLTSANAVRFAGDQLSSLRGLPVYAVGPATAEAAREAGFDIASTGDQGAERLLGSIEPGLKLLHLAAEERRTVDAPQEITVETVYRAKPIDEVDLEEAPGSVVLVHSPRAGRRLAELVDAAGLDRNRIAIAAISPEAAKGCGGGWAILEATDQPTDDALLVLAERLCNKVRAT